MFIAFQKNGKNSLGLLELLTSIFVSTIIQYIFDIVSVCYKNAEIHSAAKKTSFHFCKNKKNNRNWVLKTPKNKAFIVSLIMKKAF